MPYPDAIWYAMYGGTGSGKTQLAILFARSFSGRKAWMRLCGLRATARLILESALNKIVARQPNQSTQEWCESVCAQLGRDSIVVVDDLPCGAGDAATYEYLIALCVACVQSGVRLLSTSVNVRQILE